MRHIVMLDGLRGVAAFTVVLYHLLEVVPLIARFAAIRLVRLYPLIAAGVALGAIVWLADGGRGYGPCQVLAATAFALLMLPVPRANGGRAWPINNSLWSLAFELVGNLAYALAATRLTTRALALGTAALLPALLATSWANDGLMVGPLWRASLPLGLVRMAFPFALGLLLARRRPPAPAIPAAGPLSALLLLGVLWAPVPHGAVYDAAAVALAFPVVLLLALGGAPGPRTAATWVQAGALSYPVYALHQPFVQLAGTLARRVPPDGPGHAAVAAGTLAAIVLVSWAALRFYDRPVRAWLARCWLNRRRPTNLRPA